MRRLSFRALALQGPFLFPGDEMGDLYYRILLVLGLCVLSLRAVAADTWVDMGTYTDHGPAQSACSAGFEAEHKSRSDAQYGSYDCMWFNNTYHVFSCSETQCGGTYGYDDGYRYKVVSTCPAGTVDVDGVCEEDEQSCPEGQEIWLDSEGDYQCLADCEWPERRDMASDDGVCYMPDNVCPPNSTYAYNPNDEVWVCVGSDSGTCPDGWSIDDPVSNTCVEDDPGSSSSSSSSESSSSSSESSSSSSESSSSSMSSSSWSGSSAAAPGSGGSGPGSGSGAGDGSDCPEGETCSGTGNASGTCDAPPICTGNDVECAQLLQEWHHMCYDSDEDPLSDEKEYVDGLYGDYQESRVDDINQFAQDGVHFDEEPNALKTALLAFVPNPQTCTDQPITLLGFTSYIDCQFFNSFKLYFGWFLAVMAAAHIWSFAIKPVQR